MSFHLFRNLLGPRPPEATTTTTTTMARTKPQPKPQSKPLSIIFLGSAKTGKTNILTSHLFNVYTSFYAPTFDQVFLGPGPPSRPDISRITYLDVGTSSDVVERYYEPRLSISDVVVLVFSLVDRGSLKEVLERWWPMAKPYRKPVILVGTKKDLRSENVPIGTAEEVLELEGTRVAQEIGAVWYGECSAVTEEGLSDVVENAVRAGLGERPVVRKRVGIALV